MGPDRGRWGRYRVTFRTILTKEVLRFSRIWVQTILPSVITTGLYFVIFGRLIGDRIGTMDGLAYLDFIVPGLVLMAVITNSYSNVVSSFYSSKFSRYVEELLRRARAQLGDPGGLRGRGHGAVSPSARRSCWSPCSCRGAGAQPGGDPAGGPDDRHAVLPGRLHQRRLCRPLRRYLHHPYLCPPALDLSGRGLLFHLPLATLLADSLPDQSRSSAWSTDSATGSRASPASRWGRPLPSSPGSSWC